MLFWTFGWLCLSTAAQALGLQPLPGSLAALPTFLGRAAVISLFAGSSLSLVGLCWPRVRVDGLPWEIAGAWLVAPGALIYAIGIFRSANADSRTIVLALTLGLLGGAITRAIQIRLYTRGLKVRKREQLKAPT